MYSYHKPFHFEQQVVDPDIHFNYIKAAAKTGQIKVLRMQHGNRLMFYWDDNEPFDGSQASRYSLQVRWKVKFLVGLYLILNHSLTILNVHFSKIIFLASGQSNKFCYSCQETVRWWILWAHSVIPIESLVEECEKRYANFLSSLHMHVLWPNYFLILASMCRNHLLITLLLEHVLSEESKDINVCKALQWKFL